MDWDQVWLGWASASYEVLGRTAKSFMLMMAVYLMLLLDATAASVSLFQVKRVEWKQRLSLLPLDEVVDCKGTGIWGVHHRPASVQGWEAQGSHLGELVHLATGETGNQDRKVGTVG